MAAGLYVGQIALRDAPPLRLSGTGGELPEAFADNQALALRIWACAKPLGSDFADKLEVFIRQNPVLARALARSFLQAKKFECTKEDATVSDCGSPGIVIGDVAPDAALGDPCLNRALMRWALHKGGLGDVDVRALRDDLGPLLTARETETELPEDVLGLADKLAEPLRLALLTQAPPELAAKHIKGLSDASLVELYQRNSLAAAVLALDRTVHRELVLQALNDGALDTDARMMLLDHVVELSGDDATTALAELAESGHCQLSTLAALELARRGDKSYLPRHPKAAKATARALGIEICRLGFLPDAQAAQALFLEFLPPTGKVELVDDSTSEDEGRPRTCARSVPASCELPPIKGDVELRCNDNSCELQMQDWEITLSFARGKNQRLYLVRIARRDLSIYDTCQLWTSAQG